MWYSVPVAIIMAWLFLRHKRSISLPLPPGPKKKPLVGSLLSLPRGSEGWETYKEWGKEYNSDILHVGGVGISIIILNSLEAVRDLFEQRSANYSSRPVFSIVEMMGWEYLISNLPYSEHWRERRKLFQKHFHPGKPGVHQPKIREFVSRRLLLQLLESPEEWDQIVRHTIGASILSLAYGLQINDLNDPYVSLAERAVHSVNQAYNSPIAFLMDLIPPLKYIPEWCPGGGYTRQINEWRKLALSFKNEPYNEAKRLITEGKADTSFVSMCLDDLNESKNIEEDEVIVKETAGMFFAGGVDTSLAFILTFILAMILHPDKQAKVQEELDRVIGHGTRLPEWGDEKTLPYLAAVIKEVARWRPVGPQGVPHSTDKDDVYKGYHIPKNSIVIPNVWLILRNEKDYPSPDEFMPERFLDEQGQLTSETRDPIPILFGFGRRTCAGTHIAQSTIFLFASTILSTFNLSKCTDKDGNVKEPSLDWPALIVCAPLPFECKFTIRSEKAKSLVQSLALDN